MKKCSVILCGKFLVQFTTKLFGTGLNHLTEFAAGLDIGSGLWGTALRRKRSLFFSLTFAGVLITFSQSTYAAGIDQYTTLLVHSNTSNGDTTFTDSSLVPHSILSYGSVRHSSSQAHFGSSSIFFDVGYLAVPNHSDWNFGGSDFTLDFWVFPGSTSESPIIEFGFDQSNRWSGDNSVSWRLELNSSDTAGSGMRLGVLDSNFGWHRYITNTSHFSGEWRHIAVVRAGDTLMVFENGHEVFSEAIDYDIRSNNTLPLKIGVISGNDGHYYLQGYLDEIRISKGIARWTDDFTPPTEPYSAVPIPTTLVLLGSGLFGLLGLRRKL